MLCVCNWKYRKKEKKHIWAEFVYKYGKNMFYIFMLINSKSLLLLCERKFSRDNNWIRSSPKWKIYSVYVRWKCERENPTVSESSFFS